MKAKLCIIFNGKKMVMNVIEMSQNFSLSEYSNSTRRKKRYEIGGDIALLIWMRENIWKVFAKTDGKNHGNKIHFEMNRHKTFMTYGRWWWLGSALVKWPNLYLNQSAQSVRANSHLCSVMAVKQSESDSCIFYGNELSMWRCGESVAHELIMTGHVKCPLFQRRLIRPNIFSNNGWFVTTRIDYYWQMV